MPWNSGDHNTIEDLICTSWRCRRSADYDDDDTFFDTFIDYVRRHRQDRMLREEANRTTRKRRKNVSTTRQQMIKDRLSIL